MKFTAFLLGLATSVLAVSISYDQAYDNTSTSLAEVACSDGSNGLLTKGFTTLGSLPNFPSVGGAAAIPGWNSTECGSCWELTFNGTTVTVLAVDHTEDGFNISEEAMNLLTGGQAVAVGRVDATVAQVNASACGL
ncbi:hypothetical protein PHLCEN_2v6773 [Hermanssonia centrifuga]|uniref:Cerato-platanin n=1 Tax=Hermanssonia centrifuga TaxID=98765 RepID=A0A2R6NYH0_9APHY|nr:hypothetical protein PHLCEN_2v6773 [Hermanssonia centrifuga]